MVIGTESRPVLLRWSVAVGQAYQDSYALFSARGQSLIDPALPDASSRFALERYFYDYPVATLLTSAWHERAAYEVRGAYGVPVWSPEAGKAEMEGRPDHLFTAGDKLPCGVEAIAIDEGFAGDSALLWEAPGGAKVLFTGDAVMGGLDPDAAASDHWRRQPGLYAYMHGEPDPERFRRSLGHLLNYDFDILCSAHSPPVADRPKESLARLLADPDARFVRVFDGVGLIGSDRK